MKTRIGAAITAAAAGLVLAACSTSGAAPTRTETSSPENTIRAYEAAYNKADCPGMQKLMDPAALKKYGLDDCAKVKKELAEAPHVKVTINNGSRKGDTADLVVTTDTTYADDGQIHTDTTHFFLKRENGQWLLTGAN